MLGTPFRTRRPRGVAAALVCAVAAGLLTAAPAAHAVSGTPAADGAHAFTAQLRMGGDAATTAARGCSGVLVHQQWLLTAASCFTDTPGSTVPAGRPAAKTTATLGGQTVDVVEVVPRADRDVALARLARPVTGVTPIAPAASAAVAGETLTGAGFGRTKTSWVPDRLHTGDFRVDAVDATTVSLTGQDGVSVCMGDTGGPALRQKDGGVELVALHSRSWQGGCYGAPASEVRTGAVDSRVDDLGGWIKEIRNRDRITPADVDGDGKDDLVVQHTNGDVVVHRNLGARFDAGRVWSTGWGRFVDGKDLGRLYFADITGDGKADLVVHGTDGNIAVRKNMGTYFDGGTHWSAGWGRFVDGSDLGRLYFADITGDGKADLVVHGTDGKITVRKNMGTYFDGGTHWSAGWGRFVTGADGGRLRFGDATGDGKADLFVHEAASGNVSVRKNMGTYFDGGTLMITI
ncbi:trypsin-like serine protease [Streptomyces kanasensis]|uniref:trypsin-like serine protease n=1 Tax=Streptomyces kanasensis TaxID=936756 RepID=UPI000A86B396|nr:trypsin-like serine protease [Streptomyces kanasensis]